MTEPLFVYGTLRDADLLAGALGRPLPESAVFPATAPGFAAVHYPGRTYPALIRQPGASAEGLLLFGLTPFELDLLDAYEGDEYRRARTAVIVDAELHEAMAYFPVVSVIPNAVPWSLADWQRTHKPRVLATELASLEQLRVKLVAIRPN